MIVAGRREKEEDLSMPGKFKVTVIGAGNIGGTTALHLAMRNIADVVLVDIVEGLPQGKALDILESGPILRFDSNVIGTNDYEDTAGSDVVVITSGKPRQPGMSRTDLLNDNQEIVGSVTEQVVENSPNAIIIVVANPLDAMCHVALETSGFPRERVIGMAGVSGVPITQMLSQDEVDAIVQRTRQGGGEIVELLGSGSAFYAPAAAIVEMVDAILMDQKRILPCATYLQGEYGINDLFVGVPVKLGAGGVEEVIELGITDEEMGDLNDSADSVRE